MSDLQIVGDVASVANAADDREQPEPDPHNGRHAVPGFLRVGAAWAWRFCIIAIAIAIVTWIAARLRIVLIPVFVSVILTALLAPLVGLLDRWMPRLLATWISMLSVLGSLIGLGFLLQGPVVSAVDDLRTQWDDALVDVKRWLSNGPLGLSEARVDNLFREFQSSGRRFTSGLLNQPASTARLIAEVLAGVFLTIVLTFFLLKDGRSMWQWLLDRVRPVRRTTLDRSGRAAFSAIQGWIRGIAITGLVDGILIGAVLLVLGVPAAIPLAVITFFASFFPVVGATAAGVLATAVALTTEGPGTAAIVAVAVLVIQQVEGDVLLPIVMYRQVSLHPVVILLSLAVGATIAGFVGAIVAIPVTAAVSAAIGAARACPDDEIIVAGSSASSNGSG